MSREYPWIEDEGVISSEAKKKQKREKVDQVLPIYPADHKVGGRVPAGGSNCDKCPHLVGPQKCDDKEFIAWNGSSKIPEKTSRYCCDFFPVG